MRALPGRPLARVAQPEERRHDTPEVAGAEPAGGTMTARGGIANAPARGAGAREGVRVRLPPSRPSLESVKRKAQNVELQPRGSGGSTRRGLHISERAEASAEEA